MTAGRSISYSGIIEEQSTTSSTRYLQIAYPLDFRLIEGLLPDANAIHTASRKTLLRS